MDDARTFRGGCHCGALRITFRTATPPDATAVRACQCSFCRRHQSRTVADPAGKVTFAEHEPGVARRYRFGLNTADYLICSRCGVYIGAAVTSADSGVAIVNVPALDERELFTRAPVPVVYDDEDAAARLARRHASWTPFEGALRGPAGSSG